MCNDERLHNTTVALRAPFYSRRAFFRTWVQFPGWAQLHRGRFAAWRRAARKQKEGQKRNGGEEAVPASVGAVLRLRGKGFLQIHTFRSGLLTERASPVIRQTQYQMGIGSVARCCIQVCILVVHFSSPLETQPFRNQSAGQGGCHRLLGS